jgi:hypothetical protein
MNRCILGLYGGGLADELCAGTFFLRAEGLEPCIRRLATLCHPRKEAGSGCFAKIVGSIVADTNWGGHNITAWPLAARARYGGLVSDCEIEK